MNRSQQFLWSIGLGAFTNLRACFGGRNDVDEAKKPVISTSRWTALSRCGVHLLPTIVSISIIVLNLRQVFIGIDFSSSIRSETINSALLQVSAKLQELLIIASLATVIFQLIRDELMYGDGLPLGLVGAGIEFTKLSYFWSPQIVGSFGSLFKGERKFRKIQLGAFLILAGLLALLSGPACAVLLIPRDQDWPAGGTTLFLSGTKDDLWPADVTQDHVLPQWCSNSSSVRYGFCPSGGYHSLWAHYAKVDLQSFRHTVPSYANELSGNQNYWTLDSMPPVKSKLTCLSSTNQKAFNTNHFTIQPHLTVAELLEPLMSDWYEFLLKRKGWHNGNIQNRQAASSTVFNPYVHASCGPGKILTASENALEFPTNNQEQPLRRVDSLVLPNNATNHLTFSWTRLPPTFDSVTTGAILQSAWSSDNRSRLAIPCSVSAQWVGGHVRTDSYVFWQGWYLKNITFELSYPKKGDQPHNKTGELSRSAISVDESWLRALTPPTPVEGPGSMEWGPSTIESLISSIDRTTTLGLEANTQATEWQNQDNSDRSDLLASVIENVVADGLARINSHRLFDLKGEGSATQRPERKPNFERLLLSGKDAFQKPDDYNDVKIRVDYAISGLSYQNTLSQKLAMIVLVLHMIVAVGHTVWMVTNAKSSACWTSIPEWVALAQNSRPACRDLKNVGAGIRQVQTFAKKVHVRQTKLDPSSIHGEQEDHLELAVQETEQTSGQEMNYLPSRSLSNHSDRPGAEPSGDENSLQVPSQSRIRRESTASAQTSMSRLSATLSEPSSPLIHPSTRNGSMMARSRVREDTEYG